MSRHFDPEAVGRLVAAVGVPDTVSIRPWTPTDFPAVQRLSEAEGWPTPVERPLEALAGWQDSWPALVAESGGQVIGFLRAARDGHITVYVAELFVAPDWRGKRIGRALLDCAQLLSPGSRLDLLATESSRSYYESLGFREFYGFRRSWLEFVRDMPQEPVDQEE